YEVILMCGRCADGPGDGDAADSGIVFPQQLICAILNPSRDVTVGRTAMRWIVLEASVFRRGVRRRDNNAVSVMLLPSAVVDQDRAGNNRSRRHAVVPLEYGFDAICRQYF